MRAAAGAAWPHLLPCTLCSDHRARWSRLSAERGVRRCERAAGSRYGLWCERQGGCVQVEAFLYKPDGTMDVAKLRRQLGQHLEDLSSLLAQELLQDDAHADGALSDGEREDLYQREGFLAGLLPCQLACCLSLSSSLFRLFSSCPPATRVP